MPFSETTNPAIDVVSFGCRLNACESEVVAHEAARAGMTDIVVVNTCAVTGEAVAQARQTIRKLRRERPERRIVVTGCAAQTQPEMFAGMDEVDRVIGNDDKLQAKSWLAARAGARQSVMQPAATRSRSPISWRSTSPARGKRLSAGAAARLCADPERLRPSLHVLHHSVRPRQFALGCG